MEEYGLGNCYDPNCKSCHPEAAALAEIENQIQTQKEALELFHFQISWHNKIKYFDLLSRVSAALYDRLRDLMEEKTLLTNPQS